MRATSRKADRETAELQQAVRQACRAPDGVRAHFIFAKFLPTVSFEKYCRPALTAAPQSVLPFKSPACNFVCLPLPSHDLIAAASNSTVHNHIHAHSIHGMQVMGWG